MIREKFDDSFSTSHSIFKIHLKYFCSIEKFILKTRPFSPRFGFNFSTEKIGVVKSFKSEPPPPPWWEGEQTIRFPGHVSMEVFWGAEENGQGLAPCLD